MAIKRGPFRVVRGPNDHATVINFLRDVADELEGDADVRGVVVVVDRGSKPSVRFVSAGRLERAQDRLAVVLHRATHKATHGLDE